MSGAGFNSVLRFVLLAVAQIFLFNQVAWGWGGKAYLFIFVYPLFLAFLPLRTPRPLVIFLSFLLGLIIDFFSETLGLHAGALTFTAYCRPLILQLLQPRDGYNIKAGPTAHDQGKGWMLRYLLLVLLFHVPAFFLLQTFSIFFFSEIVVKSLLTLPASFLVLAILVVLFNPKA